jgi:rhamnogalacturonan acetylesterase
VILFCDVVLISPTCLLLDVVIEFGHNDGGSPNSSITADVYGDDDSATQTVTLANGTVEVVHTFT